MLTTENLVLGPIETSDAPLIHVWQNDKEIQSLSADEPRSETLNESEQRVQRWINSNPEETLHWAIRHKDCGLVGFAHLALIERRHARCHIGIVIGEKSLWGRGYGTEVCVTLTRYALQELSLNRVAAETYSTNPRSMRMLERAGFKREGTLRESIWKDQFVDEHLYGLLASDLAGRLPTE